MDSKWSTKLSSTLASRGFTLHAASAGVKDAFLAAGDKALLAYFPELRVYGIHSGDLVAQWDDIRDNVTKEPYCSITVCHTLNCQSCELCRCAIIGPGKGSLHGCIKIAEDIYDTHNVIGDDELSQKRRSVDMFFAVTTLIGRMAHEIILGRLEYRLADVKGQAQAIKYKERAKTMHRSLAKLHSTMFIFSYYPIVQTRPETAGTIIVFAINEELAIECANRHKVKTDGPLKLSQTLPFPKTSREDAWESLSNSLPAKAALQYHANGIAFWHNHGGSFEGCIGLKIACIQAHADQ